MARRLRAETRRWGELVASHDCNGPVVWVAFIRFMAHIPNALIMEVVRAYFSTWYLVKRTGNGATIARAFALPDSAGGAQTPIRRELSTDAIL